MRTTKIFKRQRKLLDFKHTKIYHVKVSGVKSEGPESRDLIFDHLKDAEEYKKLLKRSHLHRPAKIEPIVVLHELLDGYMEERQV